MICKHSTPLTGIDPDNAIEQEHKKMKAKGGFEFIGITDNEESMDKHFVTALTLSRPIQEFNDHTETESR